MGVGFAEYAWYEDTIVLVDFFLHGGLELGAVLVLPVREPGAEKCFDVFPLVLYIVVDECACFQVMFQVVHRLLSPEI